jgi:hypothetical protein
MKWIHKWIQPKPVKPLGRWGWEGDSDLKADYANMDSCGDILCGKPDYFKPNVKKRPYRVASCRDRCSGCIILPNVKKTHT